MTIHKTGLMVAAVLAASLAGCQSDRLGRLDTARSSVPEPLEPAPAGSVTAEPLPAPTGPVAPAAEGQFPETPGGGTQVAAATPADAAAAGKGADISKNAMLGTWKTASGGANCQMFLTLTKQGSNSRGGTKGCGGDLANMRAWNAEGKQVVLYDQNGTVIARLYQSAGTRFDGQTTSGLPVSLTR